MEALEAGEEARDHYEAVCEGLETFLKTVVGSHSEMRAVRVSRHLEMKKLSRLEVTSVESRAREIGPGQASHRVSQQVRKQGQGNCLFLSQKTKLIKTRKYCQARTWLGL